MSSKKYRKIKKKLIKKYDKNKDDFISIDEYLAKEISRGPCAKPGKIGYNYQNYENIYNYFLILLKKIKYFKIMCIPNYVLKYNNNIVRTASGYDLSTDTVYFSEKIRPAIDKCKRDKKVRFVFFTFIVIPSLKHRLSHANIVIIDLMKKTFERFEPYGKSVPDDRKNRIRITLDRLFNGFVKKHLGLQKYKYISPVKISPKLGIQSVADSYCGLCISISMMYLQLRIMNPDVKNSKIVNYLLKIPKNKLKNIILRYVKYIEQTLKDESDFVDFLNTELYNKLWQLE